MPGAGQDVGNQEAQAPCPPGQYCAGGVAALCPAGVYGATPELQSPACSGLCAAGYYCPPGSTTATEVPCGGEDVYCPEGSGLPRVAPPGMYTVGPSSVTRNDSAPCPSGSFCVGGVLRPCDAGSFGCADRQWLPTCNGPCTAGYYCPAGSTSSRAEACGGGPTQAGAAAHYCPAGSAEARVVGIGNYSTGSPDDTPHLRTGQAVCPAGHFCDSGVLVREDSIPPPLQLTQWSLSPLSLDVKEELSCATPASPAVCTMRLSRPPAPLGGTGTCQAKRRPPARASARLGSSARRGPPPRRPACAPPATTARAARGSRVPSAGTPTRRAPCPRRRVSRALAAGIARQRAPPLARPVRSAVHTTTAPRGPLRVGPGWCPWLRSTRRP